MLNIVMNLDGDHCAHNAIVNSIIGAAMKDVALFEATQIDYDLCSKKDFHPIFLGGTRLWSFLCARVYKVNEPNQT